MTGLGGGEGHLGGLRAGSCRAHGSSFSGAPLTRRAALWPSARRRSGRWSAGSCSSGASGAQLRQVEAGGVGVEAEADRDRRGARRDPGDRRGVALDDAQPAGHALLLQAGAQLAQRGAGVGGGDVEVDRRAGRVAEVTPSTSLSDVGLDQAGRDRVARPLDGAHVAGAADDAVVGERLGDQLRDLEVERRAADQHDEVDPAHVAVRGDLAQRAQRVDGEDAALGVAAHAADAVEPVADRDRHHPLLLGQRDDARERLRRQRRARSTGRCRPPAARGRATRPSPAGRS